MRMTTEQILTYLRQNKDILSVRAIGINAGFNNLSKVVSGQVDGRGFPYTFPEKYVKPVAEQIKRLQLKFK